MALNHSIKDVVFFYWLNLDALVILLLILSRIVLLILPISDLVGLISQQVGLLAKFGLWFFSVMNASFRHGLMLLWVKEECRNVGSMNCYFLVTFINSLNQSSIKPCLIVHLVAMWTLIYFECVFVGCGVHPVIDAQFRCDVFVFWMDGSCGIQLCFFVGLCDIAFS